MLKCATPGDSIVYETYFKIICAMGVEHRDKGSALFHITFCSIVCNDTCYEIWCNLHSDLLYLMFILKMYL